MNLSLLLKKTNLFDETFKNIIQKFFNLPIYNQPFIIIIPSLLKNEIEYDKKKNIIKQ